MKIVGRILFVLLFVCMTCRTTHINQVSQLQKAETKIVMIDFEDAVL